MLKEVTTQRRMPPWHADPRYGHFANDRRLTREEIETLAAWVDGGMAQGDDKDLPKPIAWPEGWTHGQAGHGLRDAARSSTCPATGVRALQELGHRHELHRGPLGADRRVPARGAGRGASHRRLHPRRTGPARQPVGRGRVDVGPGRLGAGRPGAGVPARHRAARAQGGPAAARDALHAQRHGGQGSLGDRHHLRQEAAEVRAVHERVRQHGHRGAAARPALPGRGDAAPAGRRPHHQLRAAHALARQGLLLRGDLSRRQDARRCCRCRAGTSTGRASTASRSR